MTPILRRVGINIFTLRRVCVNTFFDCGLECLGQLMSTRLSSKHCSKVRFFVLDVTFIPCPFVLIASVSRDIRAAGRRRTKRLRRGDDWRGSLRQYLAEGPAPVEHVLRSRGWLYEHRRAWKRRVRRRLPNGSVFCQLYRALHHILRGSAVLLVCSALWVPEMLSWQERLIGTYPF